MQYSVFGIHDCHFGTFHPPKKICSTITPPWKIIIHLLQKDSSGTLNICAQRTRQRVWDTNLMGPDNICWNHNPQRAHPITQKVQRPWYKATSGVLCPDHDWSELFWEQKEDLLNMEQVVIILWVISVHSIMLHVKLLERYCVIGGIGIICKYYWALWLLLLLLLFQICYNI